VSRREFMEDEARARIRHEYLGRLSGAVVLASEMSYRCRCGFRCITPGDIWDHVKSAHNTGEGALIDISGLDKAKVLAALHRASKQQGMGFLDPRGALTEEEARELLAEDTYFDYLHGRVLKVDLSGDGFDPWLYDRDNGEGAAERAIAPLREPAP
jgi:hypothetical protein